MFFYFYKFYILYFSPPASDEENEVPDIEIIKFTTECPIMKWTKEFHQSPTPEKLYKKENRKELNNWHHKMRQRKHQHKLATSKLDHL